MRVWMFVGRLRRDRHSPLFTFRIAYDSMCQFVSFPFVDFPSGFVFVLGGGLCENVQTVSCANAIFLKSFVRYGSVCVCVCVCARRSWPFVGPGCQGVAQQWILRIDNSIIIYSLICCTIIRSPIDD